MAAGRSSPERVADRSSIRGPVAQNEAERVTRCRSHSRRPAEAFIIYGLLAVGVEAADLVAAARAAARRWGSAVADAWSLANFIVVRMCLPMWGRYSCRRAPFQAA